MATTGDNPMFQRPPNHLNPMLCDVAKLVHFKNAVHGEDLDWAISMLKNGFLQYEYRREPIQVHYIYNMGERTVHPIALEMQQGMTYEKMLSMVFTPAGYTLSSRSNNQERKPAGGLRLGRLGFVSTQ
jgi:hypothetical protein